MADEPPTVVTPLPDLRLEIQGGLATLTFDRQGSKVNLLTQTVMLRLDEALTTLAEAVERGEAGALVLRSAKPRNFIAGADIDELSVLDDAEAAAQISRRGQQILLRLEGLAVPTLAAIHGACVGGGLELALACDLRVASDDPATRVGLPETRLGILPGLGGTVRLPRLIGLRPALDLILSGRQIRAPRAHKLGLVDRVLDAERFDEEVDALAARLADGEHPIQRRSRSRVTRALQDGPPARWLIRAMTRRAVLARSKGHYPALPLALEVTVGGLATTSQLAHEREAEAFGRLAVTPESKNLITVFKLTEGARKREPPGQSRSVERGAVIGAGIMGAGIAELFAYQAIPVRVVDIDDERMRSGVDRARSLLEKAAGRAGWNGEELERRLDCLQGATNYEGFENVDLVIEAVAENMDVKRKVFALIEERVAEGAVLATNTSALSVSELQKNLRHPGRVCGLHFFNPPHRMPLVEVVRGDQTSDEALATAFALALKQGKTPVVVNDSPGFVVNRILAAYLTEAAHLLQAGMAIKALDRIMSRFGMPVGPLRLLDEIGLDIVADVSQTMHKGLGERFAPAPVMSAVLAAGVTGRKGGRGFYRYSGSKPRGINHEIERIVREAAQAQPPEPQDAEERMVFSMINEAARTLDDGVVDAPETIDVAMIMGTGFPPFRGGLLRYADSLGLAHVVTRLRRYSDSVDPRFAPAPGLLDRKAFYTPK